MRTDLGIRSKEVFVSHYLEKLKESTMKVVVYREMLLDNKKFWKRVKPLFRNKIKGNSNIMLAEGNNLITDLIVSRDFQSLFCYGFESWSKHA